MSQIESSKYKEYLASRKKKGKSQSLFDIKSFKYNEKISTGSFLLDHTIGGGVRVGMLRVTAPRECGKSMFALGIAKNWQETIKNGKVIYIDAEARMFTAPEKIEASGVSTDPDKWELHVENCYEEVAELVDFYSDEKDGDRYLFIIDSVDALLRDEDSTKKFGESARVGGGGTTASHMMKKTYIDVAKNGHLIILLSQHRDKLPGGTSGNSDGSGGHALSHWSSLILKARKIYPSSLIQEGFPSTPDPSKRRIGHMFTVDIAKSYNESTGETVSIPIKRYSGIWREYEAMMICEMWDLIEKAGSWISFDDSFLAEMKKAKIIEDNVKLQGKNNLMEFLESNPSVVDFIFKYVKKISAT